VRALSAVLLLAGVAASAYRSVRSVQRLRRVEALRPPARQGEPGASVVAVIPARNEAAVIDDCLRGLRSQSHGVRPGVDPLRIVAVDDASTDATGEIMRRHAAEDPRVSVVRTDGPPSGWKGKVHAMHAGVVAAGSAPASGWLLFVDADVVVGPEALDRLLATATATGADLVSTPGGPPPGRSLSWPLLVPPGLQMIGENAEPDGRGRKAFAIGHCILIRRRAYEELGGWAALRNLRNEDVALATAVRDHGGTTRLVDGLDHVTTSGMDPWAQGWASFRKSFVAGTHGSVPVLLGGGLGQILLSLAAPAAVVAGRGGVRLAGIVGWAAQAVAHRSAARLMRSEPQFAPLAPLAGALFGGVLIDGARHVLRGSSGWKGRLDR
jgi:hypothetical protein